MPNWTMNIVTFAGKDADDAYDLMGDQFSLSKVRPVPEDLMVEDGSNTDRAIVYYLTDHLADKPSADTHPLLYKLVTNHFAEMQGEDWVMTIYDDLKEKDCDEKLYALGRRYVENFRNHGALTWYDWCCREWGTKWDACDGERDGDTYVFNTAWAAPLPVFAELSMMFPHMTIHAECVNEDDYEWGDEGPVAVTGHIYEFRAGALTLQKTERRPIE